MFRKIDDFSSAYQTFTAGTKRLFDALSDDSLDQSVGEGFRTLRQIAWHIVVTVPEMMSRAGLPLSSLDHETPPPAMKTEIQAGYKKVASELVKAIEANWNDETLLQQDDMYGEKWARGQTLTALIEHENHHRGQMTVLLRQAGRKVPGLMGPAKEEWGQYGLEAPSY